MEKHINSYLKKYREKNIYPWHMPGHKRQGLFGDEFLDEIHSRDFTEAEGLDDMHQPESFMADALAELRELYGTVSTRMLVNGSTGGILAAVHACVKNGDTVVVARNCHKAVYNALSLLDVDVEYLVPDFVAGTSICGAVTAASVSKKIEETILAGRTPTAVVITSPTYEGVISDVAAIADVCHKAGVRLIVDEAHGAHLNFVNPELSAVCAGADVVVQSTHKTLPALTQTGLIHVNDTAVDAAVSKYLKVFQTSSPSYVFMQSIEKAVAYMANEPEEVAAYVKRVCQFRKKCEGLANLRLFGPGDVSEDGTFAYDICKLVLMLPGHGPWLASRLYADFGLAVEMESQDYVILMTSVADGDEAFGRLFQAVKALDQVAEKEQVDINHARKTTPLPAKSISSYHAKHHTPEQTHLLDAVGRVAAEYICAYPPGTPIIVPGETFDEGTVADIQGKIDAGLKVLGVRDGQVEVIK